MPVAVTLVALVAGLVVTCVVCTGLGAHRRGRGIPLSVVAALGFPVTWVVWYVTDEHPYARATPRV